MGKNGAPWALFGEGVVALIRHRGRAVADIPKGMHRMPGPIVVLAERFVDSPAGPFVCLSIGEPVRAGSQVGLYFGISVINSGEARQAGEDHWGFPHELGSLHWSSDASSRTVVWKERNLELRCAIKGRPLPLLFPMSSLQSHGDSPVVTPRRNRSLVRRARVEIVTEEGDPLESLAGIHRGFTLSGPAMHRRAVTQQANGWLTPLRGVLRAPEPGVAGMRSHTASVRHGL